ncbi:PREDICTED: venom prothrombin activator nigrarin-D-like [Tinamus guttatus]|nr:PREDICTED: venom prothrombin activator nigrarin-D-like [Tinamus guttatus]
MTQIAEIQVSREQPEESERPEMERGSSLAVLLLLMSSLDSSSLVSFSVFMGKDKAHEVLKVHKRANYFLEEIRTGNLERECIEEQCSFEEAKEIFQSQEKTGEVPDGWRLASVMPIYRKGQMEDLGNSRPVNLASISGNVMEQIILRAIMQPVCNSQGIRSSQWGSRKGRPCLTNPISFYDQVICLKLEFWFHYKGLNPCNTNPCKNGGVCKIRHYTYFCICPPNFGGDTCEREKQQCWYKNGGCWHYCQDTESALEVACSCAQDYALHEDGKRCVQAASFPCGLIKGRRALEQEPLGRKMVPRSLQEQENNNVTAGSRSVEGSIGALGRMEALENTVEQSKRTEGAAGPNEVGEAASSCNGTRVDAAEQTTLEDSAAWQEPGANVTGRGLSRWWGQPVGAARQSATTGAAAGRRELVGAAARHTGGTGQHERGREAKPPRAPPAQLPGPSAGHGDTRVAGGMFCPRGQCPWQVLIRNSRDEGFCGGSLISSRWVVTAAHCLDLVRPHHVTVGDFDKYQREMGEQKLGVERSWTHPHYDSNTYNSDIALLYLSSEVTLDEFALPLCLPSRGRAALLTEEGRVGTVSGWGATHERGATMRFLMRVRVPVVSMERCQRAMDRLVTDNMFCAGYETQAEDACKGDSGGPFAVPYHNTWFLLGVVSWGEGCAQQGKYGVYTRVANYIPWIKEVVESVSDSGKILHQLYS